MPLSGISQANREARSLRNYAAVISSGEPSLSSYNRMRRNWLRTPDREETYPMRKSA
jgi:hypothetical protein